MQDSLFCSKQFHQKRISLARTALLLINYWRKLGLIITQESVFLKILENEMLLILETISKKYLWNSTKNQENISTLFDRYIPTQCYFLVFLTTSGDLVQNVLVWSIIIEFFFKLQGNQKYVFGRHSKRCVFESIHTIFLWFFILSRITG